MLTVIGCGNLNRSDDAVGARVAQRLRADPALSAREDVRILDAGTSGMEVMFHARGATSLIVIDAIDTDVEVGAIFEVPGNELEASYEPSYTLHDFRWDHALAAGRKIFRENFPQDVTVFLIQAGNLGFGFELTPAVDAAAVAVTERIRERIRAHAG